MVDPIICTSDVRVAGTTDRSLDVLAETVHFLPVVVCVATVCNGIVVLVAVVATNTGYLIQLKL